MGGVVADPFQAARLILTLRRAGVTDNAILAAMEDVPRGDFVSDAVADLAFNDAALPIECGQTVLRPSVTGQMLQVSDIHADVKTVLLVGLGSGYTAALLARLVENVFAVERHKQLFEAASRTLGSLEIPNIQLLHADGLRGWLDEGPFDRIILTGLAEAAPVALLQQLSPDGHLIQPILEDLGQKLCSYDSDGKLLKYIEVVGFQPLLTGIVGD